MSENNPLKTPSGWTVSLDVTDTLTTSKSLSIPDLSWSADYAKKVDEPEEVVVVNTTSSDLSVAETCTFGRKAVKDVYAATGTVRAVGSILPITGIRLLLKSDYNFQGVNSSLAIHENIPVQIRTTIVCPDNFLLSPAVLEQALKRHYTMAFGTGSVANTRITDMAKGILSPMS